MKILYYNWVDYLDGEGRGGGVTVYQANLLNELAKNPANDLNFLCSGISYDLFSKTPRWEKTRHGGRTAKVRRYDLINSGVLSPAHHCFGDKSQFEHEKTRDVFFDFVKKTGPYDVIHFNNLEGIPASVLSLKSLWPETKLIFSLHNYYPVCPQVNLWHKEKENCLDFRNGIKCNNCLPNVPDSKAILLANSVSFNLKKIRIRPGSFLFDKGFLTSLRIAKRLLRAQKKLFGKREKTASPSRPKLLKTLSPNKSLTSRRQIIVDLINNNCDAVLAVSNRVGEVAAKFGISKSLIRTSYIGTQHAAKFDSTTPNKTIVKSDGTLTLGYLGYMRRDKGFFFLLDALEKFPASKAAKINLVFCARRIDSETMTRITALGERFGAVMHADGYAQNQLDELLCDVDVGLVPVLWEDNLPQVAIEMHARHIPLLTSDLGGAQELGNCGDMVFKAGSVRSFHAKLNNILAGKITSEAYWKDAMAPVSMDDHVVDLMAHYSAGARQDDNKIEKTRNSLANV